MSCRAKSGQSKQGDKALLRTLTPEQWASAIATLDEHATHDRPWRAPRVRDRRRVQRTHRGELQFQRRPRRAVLEDVVGRQPMGIDRAAQDHRRGGKARHSAGGGTGQRRCGGAGHRLSHGHGHRGGRDQYRPRTTPDRQHPPRPAGPMALFHVGSNPLSMAKSRRLPRISTNTSKSPAGCIAFPCTPSCGIWEFARIFG
jgi:hypothetical protein